MRTILMLLVLSTVCPATLLLTPGATAGGEPGSFVGWGYGVLESDGYLVPTFSELNPAPADGLYIDFVSLPSNFLVIPPSVLTGQAFDPLLETGIGEFFIDPATPPGTIINGTITLHYDLYSLDPDVDPTSFLTGDNTISVDASIEVTAPPDAAPEPATLFVVLNTLALGFVWRYRFGRRRV